MRFMLLLATLLGTLSGQQFTQHIIAGDLRGGYQVVAADLNHDGKIDLIALASGQTDLVWYENPSWERHVLASDLRGMINLAYWNDQIALASGFSTEAQKSTGVVSLLVPGNNTQQPWTAKEIDRLTTSHRLRWADIEGNGKKVLVDAPLTGEHAQAPNYTGHVPLVFYRPGGWKRETISDANEGVQHGVLVVDWDGKGRESLLTASFSGIDLYEFERNGRWQRTEITAGREGACPKCGSSDVAVVKLGKKRLLAAIEPWHGNELAIYHQTHRHWQRQVIEDSLAEGHTIVTVDLDGDRRDEIITGSRGKGGGVEIHKVDAKGTWSKSVLGDAIPANACIAVDLNQDDHPDLACIGGKFLRWYENRR